MSSTGLAYFEWSADVDAELDDHAAWADANPALGTRVSAEFIAGVERPGMTDDEFARERLGIWADQDGPAVLSVHDWRTCATKAQGEDPGWMRDPVTLALDITPDRSWSTIAAAGDCRDGGVAIEVLDHLPGTKWVVPRFIELVEKHGPKAIVIDPRSAAGAMIRPLEAAGIVVLEANTSKHIQACGEFFDDVVGHTLCHRRQPELDAAVSGASKRPVGDAWLWDRRGGAVITPLVAVTLARWGHLQPLESDEDDEDVAIVM